MKLRITLKDPDGVSNSLREAARGDINVVAELEEQIKSYVEYAEYVTIEIDTVTNKARVIPVRELES